MVVFLVLIVFLFIITAAAGTHVRALAPLFVPAAMALYFFVAVSLGGTGEALAGLFGRGGLELRVPRLPTRKRREEVLGLGLGGWREVGKERLRNSVLEHGSRGNGHKLLRVRDHVDVEADTSEAGVWQGRDLSREVLAVEPSGVGLDGL